jgi:hypothetical protein
LSRYMLRRSFPPLSFSPRKATTKPNMFPSLEHHYYSLLFFLLSSACLCSYYVLINLSCSH